MFFHEYLCNQDKIVTLYDTIADLISTRHLITYTIYLT